MEALNQIHVYSSVLPNEPFQMEFNISGKLDKMA